MGFPVDATVHRFVLNWISSGAQDSHNVWYFKELGSSMTAIEVATAMETAFTDLPDCFQCISGIYDLHSYTITNMDGVFTGQDVISGLGFSGGAGGSVIFEESGIITLQTLLIGKTHRGRSFLGPVGESAVSNGTLDDGVFTDMVAAWASVLAPLVSAGLEWVVASSKGAGAYTAVENIRVNNYVATQRRRLLRTRTS